MNYIPTRTETIHIAVDLDKSAYERHKADIKLFAPGSSTYTKATRLP